MPKNRRKTRANKKLAAVLTNSKENAYGQRDLTPYNVGRKNKILD